MTTEAYSEELHPRGATGGATGGQFVAKGTTGTAAGKKKTGPPPGSMSYDRKKNRGTGYGMRGGDKRVRALQTTLNRLGMKDSSGNPLAVDGKLGPKTTSAIKRLQRRLGLKADGIVSPAFLAQIRNLRAVPTAKKAKRVTQSGDDWDDDPVGDLDDDTRALVWALASYAEDTTEALSGADFNSKHPRGPDGKFLTVIDRIKNAIADHQRGGKGDPFAGFTREHLRKAAKASGIDLKRGEDRDSIAKNLLDHVGKPDKPAKVKKPSSKPAAKAKKELPPPSSKPFVWPGQKVDIEPPDSHDDELKTAPIRKPIPASRAKKISPKAFATKVAAASSGADALRASPIELTAEKTHNDFQLVGKVPPGWSKQEISDARWALNGYRGADYVEINDHLRSGLPTWFETVDSIAAIDSVLDASRLTDDVVVYRGIKSGEHVFGDDWSPDGDMTGLAWADPSYASTTADRNVADSFAERDQIVMRMLVPKGTPAVKLSDMREPDGAKALSSEAELMLGRALTYRIIADHGYDGDGKRNLDVVVVYQ